MKRVKKVRRTHLLRNLRDFCRKNRQLLGFLLLLLTGVLLGCGIFSLLSAEQREVVASVLSSPEKPTSFVGGCLASLSSAFITLVMLVTLFLLGMTAFGVPLILLVPLFFGFGLGITECYHYSMSGGLFAVALMVLPHMLIASAAVLIASAESLRMSCLFSRQLLPASAHCGGMWQDFKLYLLRFLICAVVAFAAAVMDVLLRLI